MRRITAALQRASKRRLACAAMVAFMCLWSLLLLLVHNPQSSFQHITRASSSSSRLPPLAEPLSAQMREIRAAAAAAWKVRPPALQP